MLTVVGACASSTGGGIKVSRLLVGIKCIKREIVQLAHPKSVGIIRIGGKKVGSDILRTIYIYFIAYVGILIVSVMLVSLDNFDFENIGHFAKSVVAYPVVVITVTTWNIA